MKYEVEASDKMTVADRISIPNNCTHLKNDMNERKKSDNKKVNHAEHVTKHFANMTLIENPFKTVPNSVQNSSINRRKTSADGGRDGKEASEAAQVSAFLANKNFNDEPNFPQNPRKISKDGIRIKAD